MSEQIQRDINKLYTQVAVASDQANRALRGLDDIDSKLEEKLEKIDERIEVKLDAIGDKISDLSTTVTRIEAEAKSNTKWIGWAIAALIAAGDIVFNIVSR
jgi:outer membrane murein-binding lipoprotein Lpp